MKIVEFRNSVPVVSHTTIAEHALIKARSVRLLIDNHKADLEEFGVVSFEMTPVSKEKLKISPDSKPSKTYYLNEQQATLLMTYLSNTPKVVEFKKALVKAFYHLKEQNSFKPQNLEQIILKQNEILATLSEKIGTLQEDLLFAYKQTISAQKQTIEAKPPHYNTWLTPHEADMIVRLKRDGHSLAHIQRTLQRSDFVVRRVLKEAGMYTPPYRVVHVIEEA